MDPLVVRGIIALITGVAILMGTVWLLLSMILGARMGYLVTASVLFGILILLSLIWVVTALGPKGPETTWHAIAAGKDLAQVRRGDVTYDVSSYPSAGWELPRKGGYLADLEGKDDTALEEQAARPVMDTLVSTALDLKKREEVAQLLQGELGLESGRFQVVDVRMKEAVVDGKESLIGVGRAVPSERLVAPAGVPESTVEGYLVGVGAAVSAGAPLLVAKTESGSLEVPAPASGRLISLGLRPGDKVKEGTPVAVVDISGQPGAADPVEVAAVRVRGGIRTPAVYYLIAALLLFAVHMTALGRAERARRALPQAA